MKDDLSAARGILIALPFSLLVWIGIILRDGRVMIVGDVAIAFDEDFA